MTEKQADSYVQEESCDRAYHQRADHWAESSDTNIAACRNCIGHKGKSIDVIRKTVEGNGGHYGRRCTRDDGPMVRFNSEKLGA